MTVKLAIILLHIIPLSARRRLAVGLARLFHHLSLKHRLTAVHNLAKAFPEKSFQEITVISKASYDSFALVAAEFCDIPYLNKDNLHKWVSIDGLDNYTAACREGKGVLLFGAHFGNWEIGNAALAITTSPFVFVYRILKSAFMDRFITYVRASYGNISLSKKKAMRKMIRLLRKGKTINILIDQYAARDEAVVVDFFGRKANATAGLALLALHTGAPVLPAFTGRRADGRYLMKIGPRVETVDTGSRDADILLNTQIYNKIIEDQVRKYPEQWLWLHRRWKARPRRERKQNVDVEKQKKVAASES